MAKAAYWTTTDAEARKRGEQTGLDTHAFEPQRQLQTREPLSPLVFFHISTHFTATHGVPLSSSALKSSSFQCTSPVKPKAFTSDLKNRLRSLYAQ